MTETSHPIITGIIAEYNPFHNGHAYQIRQARELTNADYIIIIMSGNFVQRGLPSILDKYTRANMALSNGADAVFELPVCYATASAEYFAQGAISLLTNLGADYVCFGSESGSLSLLQTAASILLEEPPPFRNVLQEHLKQGHAFPKAQNEALTACLTFFGEEDKNTGSLLSLPNNTLGMEYCKAISKLTSPIKPCTIKRLGNGYHEETISSHKTASASAIRQLLQDSSAFLQLKEQVPETVYSILEETYGHSYPVNPDDFSTMLHYKLIRQKKEGYQQFQDCSPELENRIRKRLPNFQSFSHFAECLHTKEMTHARINRCLLHILLDIHADTVETFRRNSYVYYARLLGFRKDASLLLSALKTRSSLPLISRPAREQDTLCQDGKKMFAMDLFAAELYDAIITEKFHFISKGEYRKMLIL